MITAAQDLLLDKRVYYGGLIFAVAALLTIGWFGYGWHRKGVEQVAYKELAESVDAYARIMGEDSDLLDSERAFAAGAKEHRSSVLYPFFLSFQADTVIRQGKLADGAGLLEQAVKAMDQQHPLYYLYALKAALVKIDTKDAALEKQGRQEIDRLASNKANPLKDMALYYKALDADTRDEQDLARSTYKQILSHGKKDSYWYQLADIKLKAGD